MNQPTADKPRDNLAAFHAITAAYNTELHRLREDLRLMTMRSLTANKEPQKPTETREPTKPERK